MILRFNNLGIIETAEIDMSKPFILFTGPNGTGKTYLSYVLADLTSSFGGYFLSLARREEEKAQIHSIYNPSLFDSQEEVSGTLDPEILYNVFKKGISRISMRYPSNLNLKETEGSPFSIEVVSTLEEWKEELYKMELDCGFFFELLKKENSFEYKVVATPESKLRDKEKNDYEFELALFLDAIFFHGAANAQMFTAERTGIALFSKELAVGRLKADPTAIPRYPRAISESLADAEDRAHHSKHKSEFKDLADVIEKDILHGKIKVTKDGELTLNRGDNAFDLALSSSTMKALADIVFYIRHQAKKMSRLLIDEPEIHLHPNNQLLLARVFSRMVHRGLQVVISTHSDYIIRELNNLIMLNYVGDDFVKKAKKMGYVQEEFIDAQKIQPYLFVLQENGRVKTEPIKVGKEGFAVKSIDDAIAGLNDAAEEIYYAMLENE